MSEPCTAASCETPATHLLRIRRRVNRPWTSGLPYCLSHAELVELNMIVRGLDTCLDEVMP